MRSTLLTRRSLVLGAGALSLTAACARPGGVEGAVRIGYLANLSHAPMIAGLASGRIAAALGQTRVETRIFRAGPRVVEALLGGAIDIGVSGPAPVVFAHARHGPGTLSVLSGCASGGASFVVSRGAGVHAASDLRGKSLATPQLGSTQDIALRKYLRAAVLAETEHGGDVRVTALAPPIILAQMRKGELDGAWLPEPWATRAVCELGASRLVDERDLWPTHAFSSALLVTRGDFLGARPHVARSVASALEAEVARATARPDDLETEAFAEIRRLLGNAGPRDVFHQALARVDFTSDPMPAAVERFAADACALGLIPRVACGTLFAAPAA